MSAERQKWEYSVIDLESFEADRPEDDDLDLDSIVRELNDDGAEGWEIAGISQKLIYLKRPVAA